MEEDREAVNEADNEEFLNRHDMRRKPVFHELSIDSGHPEHAINSINEKMEDMGFKIESSGSNVSEDRLGEDVKNFTQNIEAIRTEKQYRKNSKLYQKIAWISLAVSILITLIAFKVTQLFILAFIGWLTFVVFLILSRPKEKKDYIWIKAEAKVYSGTKSRELRESGRDRAGQTKVASSVYFHSEIKFMIAGDSEIDVKRIREDISILSKFMQKI